MKHPFLFKETDNWYLYYFVGGKRKKISTGKKNKHEAKTWADNFLANDNSVIEYQFIKASDFCREFTDSLPRRPKTVKAYKTAFNQLIEFCGDKNLNQYSIKEATSFLNEKLKRSSPWTAKKYRSALITAFNRAVKLRYIKHNVFLETYSITAVPGVPRSYTDEEMSKLLSVIDNPLYKDIVLFGFYTGMRLDEILRIRKENIFNKLIILPTSKEDKPRIVSVPDALLPIIAERLLSAKEYLFEYRERKVKMETVSHIFSKYVRRAGLDTKLNFHCLRKTFGSRLLQSGVDLKVISEMLGHSSYRVTEQFYAALLKGYRDEVNLLSIKESS